jgi:molybdenum transport protein
MIYFTDAEIDQLIIEGFPYFDITSLTTKIGSKVARIAFSTRHNTVICGAEETLKIFEKFKITPTLISFSGEQIEKGIKFLEGEGLVKNIYAIGQTVANLMEFASGIATRTKTLVEIAHEVCPGIPVVMTRKSIPFTKKIIAKAIRIGGGDIQQLGLSDSILIFNEHIKFLGGLENLILKLPEIRKRAAGRSITIEVKTADEALMMAKSHIDTLQIDEISSKELKKLVPDLKKLNPSLRIAAAGNIDENNIAEFASSGVDILVTSCPYYGKSADFQINIEPVFDL